jgi:hypothetical protein
MGGVNDNYLQNCFFTVITERLYTYDPKQAIIVDPGFITAATRCSVKRRGKFRAGVCGPTTSYFVTAVHRVTTGKFSYLWFVTKLLLFSVV